jgi:hypothetical protein
VGSLQELREFDGPMDSIVENILMVNCLRPGESVVDDVVKGEYVQVRMNLAVNGR